VPANDQAAVRSTISATSLAGAQAIVGRIRGEYQTCQAAYNSLQAFRAEQQNYTKLLDAYKKKHGTTAPVRNKAGKVIARPPVKPAGTKPTIPPQCPSPSAAAGAGAAS